MCTRLVRGCRDKWDIVFTIKESALESEIHECGVLRGKICRLHILVSWAFSPSLVHSLCSVCVLSLKPPSCLTEESMGTRRELEKAGQRKWQRILPWRTGRVLTGRAQMMGWGVPGGGEGIPGKKIKGMELGRQMDTSSPELWSSGSPVWSWDQQCQYHKRTC